MQKLRFGCTQLHEQKLSARQLSTSAPGAPGTECHPRISVVGLITEVCVRSPVLPYLNNVNFVKLCHFAPFHIVQPVSAKSAQILASTPQPVK